MPMHEDIEPQQQQQNGKGHHPHQNPLLQARIGFAGFAVFQLDLPVNGFGKKWEGPSACAEGPSRYDHPTYAVTVRVGLDPHSP